MTINLPAFLQPTIGTKLSNLSEMGQELLSRDWRYQEIESAIYHRNLTAALNRVWDSWVSDMNYARPEFSVLRNMPKYIHEFEDTDLNIDKALARGASIIMACPVLSNSCNYGPISIRVKWLSSGLVFSLKNPVSIFERDKKHKYYSLDALISGILKTTDMSEDFSSEYFLQNQGIVTL